MEIQKEILAKIKKSYKESGVTMGELMSSFPANYLTIEEAHELYMMAQNWANGDKFYTILGDNPGQFVNCQDKNDIIIDFS